jgi:hypothetical protein
MGEFSSVSNYSGHCAAGMPPPKYQPISIGRKNATREQEKEKVILKM